MATTRPYLLVYKGEQHIIEATAAAEAVRHVVGEDVTELRSARAAEVSAWVRAGKPIPIAGQKSESAATTQSESEPLDPAYSESGKLLATWFLNRQAPPRTDIGTRILVERAAKIVRDGNMDLADFDAVRGQCPDFEKAIVWIIEEGALENENSTALDVDAIRGELEEKPFPLDVVMAALAYPYQGEGAVAE